MTILQLSKKNSLVNISEVILNKEVSILNGILALKDCIDINDKDDKFLLPIIGIIDDADEIVKSKVHIGEFEYIDLTKYKKILTSFLIKEQPLVFNICFEIIDKYKRLVESKNSKLMMQVKKILKDNDPIKIYFTNIDMEYQYEEESKMFKSRIKDINSEDDVIYEISKIFTDLYGDYEEKNKHYFYKIGSEIYRTDL